jgi:hypothetical protein
MELGFPTRTRLALGLFRPLHSFGRVEGVTAAAEVLKAADARLRESLESSSP